MAIRKVQYQIDLVHILTFKDEYRYALNPYFGFDNVEYGIDFENSISESVLQFQWERKHLHSYSKVT